MSLLSEVAETQTLEETEPGWGRGSLQAGEFGKSSPFPLGLGRPRPVPLGDSGDMDAGRGTISD